MKAFTKKYEPKTACFNLVYGSMNNYGTLNCSPEELDNFIIDFVNNHAKEDNIKNWYTEFIACEKTVEETRELILHDKNVVIYRCFIEDFYDWLAEQNIGDNND